MNELDFLNNFRDKAISHEQFVLNILITALISGLIALFYIRFGQTISNRRKYANNFIMLSLTTMLIIYIVKSSIALSLGLVGALSIIRFRTAIKEPEELGFLFLNIGVGLAMGANQVVVTVLAVPSILLLLLVQAKISGRSPFSSAEHMFINIQCSREQIDPIHQLIKDQFRSVLLKRIDTVKAEVTLSYQIESGDARQVLDAQEALSNLKPEITFSFIEQRNLIF
jgi:uncharacterized membrane protein YhiD involved in acid resistance